MTDKIISLANAKPFAVGKKRLVYEHPDDRSLVIKVMRPEFRPANAKALPRWSTLVPRYYFSMSFMRELREMIEMRFEEDAHPRFLHRIVGFAETDLGLGLVAVAARARDGGFAPTLRHMLEHGGIDARARADLETFCHSVSTSGVVVGDLNADNIVHAHDDEAGSYFVLVDGIGDKTLIPILRVSGFLSRRSKARKIARIWRQVDAVRPGAHGEGYEASARS